MVYFIQSGPGLFINANEWARYKKMAFSAGYSWSYKSIQMPFELTYFGSIFCHLMEMCLGDQQFVTLLLYLDDI